ncbi:hypothetical protein ATANTOWER_024467 [Ataeniobius toweri]|uniref:Uncharacterized protein n=1 Tax=Ataeniobius toweri TaxID=208326 RepID=A0ABU7A9E7_9TELE|nr:hypothetical protein [Ataeniobius toweri]
MPCNNGLLSKVQMEFGAYFYVKVCTARWGPFVAKSRNLLILMHHDGGAWCTMMNTSAVIRDKISIQSEQQAANHCENRAPFHSVLWVMVSYPNFISLVFLFLSVALKQVLFCWF